MKEYHTKIEIRSGKEKVWKVLTDFDDYPSWNPLVSRLTGDISEGGTIDTTITPLNNTFSAKLLSLKEYKELIWKGKRIAGFLLAGEHYFRLIEKGPQQTTLEHGEYFTGILSGFISKKLLNTMENAFIEHKIEKKKRVEHEG